MKSFKKLFMSVAAAACMLGGVALATQAVLMSSTTVSATRVSSGVLRTPSNGAVSVYVYTGAASMVANSLVSVQPIVRGTDVQGNKYTLCAGEVLGYTSNASAVPSATSASTLIHVGSMLAASSVSGNTSCNRILPDMWDVQLVYATSGVHANTINTGINYNTGQ